jgi:hypothetical protein
MPHRWPSPPLRAMTPQRTAACTDPLPHAVRPDMAATHILHTEAGLLLSSPAGRTGS